MRFAKVYLSKFEGDHKTFASERLNSENVAYHRVSNSINTRIKIGQYRVY